MPQDQLPKRENLYGADAIRKLQTLAEDAGVCMFTTNISKFPPESRPMSLQEVDNDGNLWFLSSTDSNKNVEMNADNRVTLYFQNKGKYEFLVVNGEAEVHMDKETIGLHWNQFANAWFEGKNDPRISVIRVRPLDCDYWDTADGKIVSFTKIRFSALTGARENSGGVSGKIQV